MKKLIQTRLHKPDDNPNQIGNCFPTVIACIMDLESAEEVIQIQEHYDLKGWTNILCNWIGERGYVWMEISEHLYNDMYYLVVGNTERETIHVCIYKNGELYHDPHPSGKGLTSEISIEIICKKEDLDEV